VRTFEQSRDETACPWPTLCIVLDPAGDEPAFAGRTVLDDGDDV